jgi:Cys-rich protein (TIGR01571 family)
MIAPRLRIAENLFLTVRLVQNLRPTLLLTLRKFCCPTFTTSLAANTNDIMSTPVQITEVDAIDNKQQSASTTSTSPATLLPNATATSFVDVVAPCALGEGYTFDAVHEGQVFSVTVPKGGVKAGETFSVPFVPHSHDENSDIYYAEAVPIATEVTPLIPTTTTTSSLSSSPAMTRTTTYAITTSSAPIGRWKDGICDCCAHGCCHPAYLNAICFRQILMGQVLTRMQMTWCGNPATSRGQYKQTFPTLLWLTISYWIVWIFFHCDEESHGGHRNCHGWRHGVLGTVQLVWFVYTVVVMIKLRQAIRNRYKIPQTQCVGCEDCCCVVICSCCTMAQLARQTADYERQRAYCCTDTGLAEERYTLEEALVV